MRLLIFALVVIVAAYALHIWKLRTQLAAETRRAHALTEHIQLLRAERDEPWAHGQTSTWERQPQPTGKTIVLEHNMIWKGDAQIPEGFRERPY